MKVLVSTSSPLNSEVWSRAIIDVYFIAIFPLILIFPVEAHVYTVILGQSALALVKRVHHRGVLGEIGLVFSCLF